ncbi:MAG: sulfite exporter TauE/SafE family protein [Armatimonadota bacterium]|nr:sulfite exporter TauE/SafE family protein [Armatimonadota bacterium]
MRGLVLLMLGWAFGALYGFTSLGLLAVFLPVCTALLGFSVERATTAGWLVTVSACASALMIWSQQFPPQTLLLPLWGTYLLMGLVVQALSLRRWRRSLQVYLLLLLAAVGLGMAWQAYPTLSSGVFRSGESRLSPPAPEEWWQVALGGALAGALGGLTGLGGGYVLVPTLVFAGIAPHGALWLSLWLMLPMALLSLWASTKQGKPSWSQEGWLSAGAFLGGSAGATWAVGLSAGMLVLCFGVVMAVLALITWRSLAVLGKATSLKDG